MFEFSPDWDARFCYLVVLGCGVVSARVQVYGRLELLKGKTVHAWSILSTWWVFSTYLVIPLVLFWLLDRTGALQDTSLFAAIFVGLAYPAIVSGGTSLKPNAGVAGVFGWLNNAADNLAQKTTAAVAVRDRLFSRAVVGHIATNKDRFDEVRTLALNYAESPASVNKELAATQDPTERAQIVYDYATSSSESLKPLSSAVKEWKLPNVTSPYTVAWRWMSAYIVIGLLVLVAVAIAVFGNRGNRWFLDWRLQQPGASSVDLLRTRRSLGNFLASDDAVAHAMRVRLADTLQRPDLDMNRVDEILRLLLEHRGTPGSARFQEVATLLVDHLRTPSVDVRARVQHSLLLLSEEVQAPDDAEHELAKLKEWKPLTSDSPIDLERHWRAWRKWWSRVSATH